MLKPRKRKQRIQMTVLGHQFVVHHPKHGRTPLSNDETNGLYSHGLMYSDARQAPYMQRQALYIASQRHRFACVGVTGLRAMTEGEWNAHWIYRHMRRMHRETQFWTVGGRGHLSHSLLTSEMRRQTSSPTPEIVEHLLRGPRESDFFFGLGPSASKPNAALTTHILKGRKPGLSSLFANGIGDSPRINPSMRKSDFELALAMKLGPEAAKKLLMERLTVPGPNGDRYFISSESGSERLNDLFNAMIKAEENTSYSIREVPPDRVLQKLDNMGHVGALGIEPSGRPPLTMAREYAMVGSWGAPWFDSMLEPFTGEVKGVELRKSSASLNNPELKGVDPFSEELTAEQKAAILEEAKINPMYFYRIVRQAMSTPWTDSRFPFSEEDVKSLTALYSLAKEHEYRPQNIDTTKKHYFSHISPEELFAAPKPEDDE
ncbi:hypothetical protein pEaSNUABM11_00160 [Erwinia phage pEa_SNUABM_11]|nr:hypothetical protein pEaSNUABM11_00160 [Erwinia phage pEa_SNUABM_11]